MRYPIDVMDESFVYELKVAPRDFIYKRQVKAHQVMSLQNAGSHHGINYKIPDVGPAIKPFDGFMLRNQRAWLVILFYKSDQSKRVFGFFDVNRWSDVDNKIYLSDCEFAFTLKTINDIPERVDI